MNRSSVLLALSLTLLVSQTSSVTVKNKLQAHTLVELSSSDQISNMLAQSTELVQNSA